MSLTLTVSGSAILRATVSRSVTGAGVLRARVTKTVTAAGVLRKTLTTTAVASAVRLKQNIPRTLTTTGVIQRRGITRTAAAGLVLLRRIALAAGTTAVVRQTVRITVDIGTVLSPKVYVRMHTPTAMAVLRRRVGKAVSASLVVYPTITTATKAVTATAFVSHVDVLLLINASAVLSPTTTGYGSAPETFTRFRARNPRRG